MINMLNGPIGDFFSKIGDILLYGLIAIIVIVCIVIMAKYEHTRKFLMYAIAVVILAGGVYSSFGLYDELTSASYVNGSFEYLNQNEETFDYSTQALLLTQDDEDSTKYVFSKSLDKVENFDATKNTYVVTFNNYELMNQVTYTAGSVYIEIPLEFMNTDGELVSYFVVYISVRFLSNSTELELWTFGSDAYSYFTQYVSDFGFRLLIEKTI